MAEHNPLTERRVCLDCKETFATGEMYPGKRYLDPLQCPKCRSERTLVVDPAPLLH